MAMKKVVFKNGASLILDENQLDNFEGLDFVELDEQELKMSIQQIKRHNLAFNSLVGQIDYKYESTYEEPQPNLTEELNDILTQIAELQGKDQAY